MKSQHQTTGHTILARPVQFCAPFLLCLLPLLPGCGGNDAASDSTPPASSAQSAEGALAEGAPAEGGLPAGWKTFAPEGEPFSIAMPGEPEKTPNPKGGFEYTLKSGELSYLAYANKMPGLESMKDKDIDEMFDDFAGALAKLGKITSRIDTTLQGHRRIELVVVTEEEALRQSQVVLGDYLIIAGYSARTAAGVSTPEADAFFNELKIKDAAPVADAPAKKAPAEAPAEPAEKQ